MYILNNQEKAMLKIIVKNAKIDYIRKNRREFEKINIDELRKGNVDVISKINGISREFDEVKRAISKIPTDKLPVDDIKEIERKVVDIEKKLKDFGGGERTSGWSFFGRR